MLVLGRTIEFTVPHDFWNITAGMRTESNHNGITGQDVHFHTAWHVESSWLFPFRAGPVPLIFALLRKRDGP